MKLTFKEKHYCFKAKMFIFKTKLSCLKAIKHISKYYCFKAREYNLDEFMFLFYFNFPCCVLVKFILL